MWLVLNAVYRVNSVEAHNLKIFSSYFDCCKLCFVSLGNGFQVPDSAVGLYLVSFYVVTTLHIVCISVIMWGIFM